MYFFFSILGLPCPPPVCPHVRFSSTIESILTNLEGWFPMTRGQCNFDNKKLPPPHLVTDATNSIALLLTCSIPAFTFLFFGSSVTTCTCKQKTHWNRPYILMLILVNRRIYPNQIWRGDCLVTGRLVALISSQNTLLTLSCKHYSIPALAFQFFCLLSHFLLMKMLYTAMKTGTNLWSNLCEPRRPHKHISPWCTPPIICK